MSKLYRYEIRYSNYDEGDTEIRLREFPVVRETEKSYCIQPYWRNKWIRKDSYNAFAHTTKQLAKDHFIRRTTKRISWFEFWTKECKKGLELMTAQSTTKDTRGK